MGKTSSPQVTGWIIKSILHSNSYSTTIIHGQFSSLPPHILPDCGQRHVKRQDHIVTQYLIKVFGPRFYHGCG